LIEAETLLTYILEVPDTNVGQITIISSLRFSWFHAFSPNKFPELCYNQFLQNPSIFQCRSQAKIRRRIADNNVK
jgi:hypothetical protein